MRRLLQVLLKILVQKDLRRAFYGRCPSGCSLVKTFNIVIYNDNCIIYNHAGTTMSPASVICCSSILKKSRKPSVIMIVTGMAKAATIATRSGRRSMVTIITAMIAITKVLHEMKNISVDNLGLVNGFLDNSI